MAFTFNNSSPTPRQPNPFDPGLPPDLGEDAASIYSPNMSDYHVPVGSPNLIRDVYAPQMAETGQKLEEAYAAPHAGMGRQILGAILSRRNPQLGGLVSGETQRQQRIEPLAHQYELLSSIIQANRQMNAQDILNAKNIAETQKAPFVTPRGGGVFNTQTQAMVPGTEPPLKPQEAAVQDYMSRINPDTKKNYTPAEALKQVSQDAQDVKPGKTVKQGLDYDPGTGIPISYNDANGQKWDVNDPHLPPEGKKLVSNANAAHKQHIQEQADAQSRANDLHQNNLTTSTRTMIETAPKVLNLINRLKPLADKEAQGSGPLGARWSDFWNNKVGAPNQDYSKMRVDDGLLATALMRMHVGARGGELMMQHFTNLLGLAHQSPENYKAALEEIEQYANDVKNEKSGAGSSTPPTSGSKYARPTKGVVVEQ